MFPMSLNWIRVSAVYFVIGIAFGIYMLATSNYEWVVYAHILILGWLTNAVIGMIYTVYRCSGKSDLAKAQFWLFNLGLLVFLIGLLFISPAAATTWIYIGAISIGLSAFLFLVTIFNNLRT